MPQLIAPVVRVPVSFFFTDINAHLLHLLCVVSKEGSSLSDLLVGV
jgi:hypothetical protein